MTVTRQNVYSLGDDWAAPILWYARAIKSMKTRALADPTSWTFYGGIHGFDRAEWINLGIIAATDPDPSGTDMDTYFDQCQHTTYYFLPWHRGYLLALENMIRNEIKVLKGPYQTWALPYWNYFGTDQKRLPPAFDTPDWPDGTGDNPLFVTQRYGPFNDGDVYIPDGDLSLDAMNEPEFTGDSSGGTVGFGGLYTGFEHGGGTFGGLESDPHNLVHVIVGGNSPHDGSDGLMTSPDTAAIDPIFWLHHCNIDRLWESWNRQPKTNPTDFENPTNTEWLDGPPSIGEREFAMPNPDGSKWVFTPGQMVDIGALGYNYDTLVPGAAAVAVASRMDRPGLHPAAAGKEAKMASRGKAELLGSNDSNVALYGSAPITIDVPVDPEPRTRLAESLAGKTSAPDRVFLNLENITGLSDSVVFKVYVGPPTDVAPSESADHMAGTVALFGVREASNPDGKHSGSGVTSVLEITRIVDAMYLQSGFNADELAVEFVPMRTIPEAAKISIGRVSIYRQGD